MDEDKVLVPDGFFPRHVELPTSSADAGTDLVVVPQVSVETVKKQLRDLALQLLTITDVAKAKVLNIDIQRRRVLLLLLQENDGTATEGDYHKEMTLLNRMLQGEEVPDGTSENDVERAERAARAEQALADRGIDPLMAARLSHVLDALVSRTKHGSGSASHG